MKRQKTQCTTQPPPPRPPKHTHTFDIPKAADFQLSFGIEVNISMAPFHPSSQVNGCYFNLLRSTLRGGGGEALKKNYWEGSAQGPTSHPFCIHS